MATEENTPVLSLRGVCKAFPGVVALDNVSLTVRAGEIHALVGENGAGKSTLIRIAAGLEQADAGEILLAERPVRVASPSAARALGIALVHQEPELFPDLSVAESMFLGWGMPAGVLGWVRWKATFDRADGAFAQIGERMNVRRAGRTLGAAERQLTDIASALAQDVLVLCLDEPTASLSRKETQALFSRLRALRTRGVAIVYISHRLDEVLALADCVSVLRDGRLVWTRPVRDVDTHSLVEAMVGRQVNAHLERPSRSLGPVRLAVEGLSTEDGTCRDISFTVRAGEILGLYGLVGAGRSECAQALIGLRRRCAGHIFLDGHAVSPLSPRHALELGLAYVPEDRLDQGLFLDLSISTNATIAVLRQLAVAAVVRRAQERTAVKAAVHDLRIKLADPQDEVATLSGGNQQKVVLGRWLLASPHVLLLDEPTRGVDIGAKAEIHALIQAAAERGMAVLLISSELPEVLAVADRVLVLREGQVAGEFDPQKSAETEVAAAAFPAGTGAIPDRSGSPRSQVRRSHGRMSWLQGRREVGLAGIVLALATTLAMTTDAFLEWRNLTDLLHNAASTVIAGAGMTLLISAGAIDISIGSMFALAAASAALTVQQGLPIWLAVGLGIAVGAVLGLINGAISVAGRIHSIIVTLGTISVYRSLLIQGTGGSWITDLPESFNLLGKGQFLAVPYPVWVMLAVVVLGTLFQTQLRAGRRLYAIGSNLRAAKTAGIRPGRYLLGAFVASGALVGLAAVLDAARLGNVQTNAGLGFELRVIAATVIGGTNIVGGSGTVVGTFLGAVLLGLLYNAQVLWRMSVYWEQLILGVLILAAVLADAQWARRRARSGR